MYKYFSNPQGYRQGKKPVDTVFSFVLHFSTVPITNTTKINKQEEEE